MSDERQYYERLKENDYKPRTTTSFGNQLGYMKECYGTGAEDCNIQDLKNVFENWSRYEREDEIAEKKIKAEEAKMLEEDRLREIEEEKRYQEYLELENEMAQIEAEEDFREKFFELTQAFKNTDPSDIYYYGKPCNVKYIDVSKLTKIYEETMKYNKYIYPANEDQELEYNRFLDKLYDLYFGNLKDVYETVFSTDRIDAFHILAMHGEISLKHLIPETLDTYKDRVKAIVDTILEFKSKKEIFLKKAEYERGSYHSTDIYDTLVSQITNLMDDVINLESMVEKTISSFNEYHRADPRNYQLSYCYFDHFYYALNSLDELEKCYSQAITYSYELSLATNSKKLTCPGDLLNVKLTTLSENYLENHDTISKELIVKEHKELINKYKNVRLNITTYDYEDYYKDAYKKHSKYSALASLKTNEFVNNPFSSIKKVDFRALCIALCFVIAYFQVSKFGLDVILAMFLPAVIISFCLYKFFNHIVKKLELNTEKNYYAILDEDKLEYFNFNYNNLEKKSAKEFVTNVLNETIAGKKEFYDRALNVSNIAKSNIEENFKVRKNNINAKVTRLAYGIIVCTVIVLSVLLFV